jgi:membrane protease YdiL (CAAX protease family)
MLATGCIIVVSDAAAWLAVGNSQFGLLPPRSGAGDEIAVQMSAVIFQMLIVGLTLTASAMFGGDLRNTLALKRPNGGCHVYVTSIVLCFLSVVSAQILLVPGGYPVMRHTNRISWVLDGVASTYGAPLAEELLFRGFFMSALARTSLGYIGAAVIASGAWAALHFRYPLIDIVILFSLGLLLSWLLWRTGSVRVPIVCHACLGAFAFLTGSSFEPRV